jgi:DNA mismatch endonuclease, patch repair protein
MAAIRSSGNKDTELRFIIILRAHDITGWRRRQRLFGLPDFVFRRERLAVFVDGCFWHGCPAHCRMPKSRVAFWTSKIARNKTRDLLVGRILRREGWGVIRFWEHHLRHPERVALRLKATLASLKKRGLISPDAHD